MLIWEPTNSFQVETKLGPGRVLFVTCWAHDNEWTVAISETSAIVTFTQDQIKMSNSYTHGRGISHERMKEVTSR